jgi:heterodisulfide reductase subunit A-like polyferredoxin
MLISGMPSTRLQHKRNTFGSFASTAIGRVRQIAAATTAPSRSTNGKQTYLNDNNIQAVVIGGGIGGLLAAHSLAKYVDRVVLLEKDAAGSARIEDESFSQVFKLFFSTCNKDSSSLA